MPETFISSLINHRLTGEFTTDRTMAGTSQLLDVKREQFSSTILQKIGIHADLFPPMVSPVKSLVNYCQISPLS